jgi:lipopolysaccharide export system protein LptA
MLRARAGLAFAALLFLAANIYAQEVPRNCDLEFPTGTNTQARQVELAPGNTVVYLGRGVRAYCIGQGNNLTADSAEYYQSQGRLYLVGNVHYTEPRATVTSNTMTYYQADNHLHAEGNVVAVTSNGSVLRGPSADYYRVTPARPLTRLFAPGRPTVTLVQKDTTGRGRPPDTAHVIANQITMEGDSLVYAAGKVQITRPDLQANGDSAFLDSGRDFARLMREPQVQGKGQRQFTLTGEVIDVYSRNRQVERVVATPKGHALSQDLELVADSIDLRVQGNQLQRAVAWGTTRARAVSPDREIIADSIDALMPQQRVREVRAVRGAYAESNPDSGIVSTQRDWMRGDTIIAHFDSLAPGDTTSKPKIREIVADGHAQSFYQMKSSNGPANKPSINYVTGRIIDILFEERKVATVTVTDQASGVMVEPVTAAVAKPAATTNQQAKPTTPPKPPIRR